ncbi:hypothetical protein MBGDF03_00506 [Thermoplasmatales archaeon SCGC AB-540-F20]|nr:hypothetical protein MBGDF03_00506 [Thermoplasmatales archaeon SCGC AB-540-F20]
MLFFSIIFFPNIISTILIIVAISFGIGYDIKGKYTPWLYEFTLGTAYFFMVFYGASIPGGLQSITPLTWVIAIIIFFETNMTIWMAGLKDVKTDLHTKIPTRAVIWNYNHEQPLTLKDKNFIFGSFVKIAILLTFSIPFIYDVLYPPIFQVNTTYFYIFLIIGIGSQLFLIYKLLGRHDREQWTKMVVLDIAITLLLAPLIIYHEVGIVGVLALFLGPILWQFLLNYIIYGTISAPKV